MINDLLNVEAKFMKTGIRKFVTLLNFQAESRGECSQQTKPVMCKKVNSRLSRELTILYGGYLTVNVFSDMPATFPSNDSLITGKSDTN